MQIPFARCICVPCVAENSNDGDEIRWCGQEKRCDIVLAQTFYNRWEQGCNGTCRSKSIDGGE